MSKPTYEQIYPLTIEHYVFEGQRPIAVLFDNERVEVKSWREAYSTILKRCNENPEHHDELMYLRNKTADKCRVFLSDRPNGMTRPLRIDEDMYGETNYGAQTLMHILCKRILDCTGFDYRKIRIVLKIGGRL